ncbi:2-oxoglutarate and iron-dependent oxygenase domain-containing protein [Rhizorhabdus sp. FW153]|uniref:2-oxoglutarate and iron-dependent oxygenase domain-containing protein n=1 Tax=Rhizorhabdus sp. FW153 TaxID=3400216 RepID=UPI003CED7C6E
MSVAGIPIIDLTPARGDDPRGHAAVARELDQAARDIGFFVVTGTGIPDAVIDDAFGTLTHFFALPTEAKDACRLGADASPPDDRFTPYGYSGMLEENAFAYMGEMGKPSDYVEKFSLGRLALDDDRSLPFPAGAVGARMRQALVAYFRETWTLANVVTGLFETGLGKPKGFFTDRISQSADSMRCHAYPALRPDFVNSQGMGAHQDGTLVTLLTHTRPGIEVRMRDGSWLRPPAGRLGDYLVNIGDLLSHWTDGAYVSTPHRAVLTESQRLSIAFFKLTDEDELTEAGDRQMEALVGRAT